VSRSSQAAADAITPQQLHADYDYLPCWVDGTLAVSGPPGSRLRLAKFDGWALLDFCGFFADNLLGRLVPMTICGVAA